MHKQEEPGQIPNTAGKRDQNTQGKTEALRKYYFPRVYCSPVIRLLYVLKTVL